MNLVSAANKISGSSCKRSGRTQRSHRLVVVTFDGCTLCRTVRRLARLEFNELMLLKIVETEAEDLNVCAALMAL